jgi:hypothetical protein
MQLTSNIMMVRPAHFGYNVETAENNAFQINDKSLNPTEIEQKAIAEFDTFVKKLRAVGVNVIVFQDTDKPIKSDAVFPNNWISFHRNGNVITYPIFSPIRRQERRFELIESLSETFEVAHHIQLESWENVGQYLEGTGSMVVDREHQIAYGCLSIRTDQILFDEFCSVMECEQVTFHSFDKDGLEVYHTNVMMAMGDKFVVICMESVPIKADKERLLATFKKTNKTIIEISLDQMYAFAGNMLQVKNTNGDTFLVMSSQAFNSLNEAQIQKINQFTQILHSDLTTIETYGGGSARCMMAEVFLPLK